MTLDTEFDPAVDDFAERLRRTSSSVPSSDAVEGLGRVHSIRRRRKQRTATLSVAAGVVTIAALGTAIAIVDRDEPSEVIVTATPPPAPVSSTVSPTTAPASSIAPSQPAAPSPTPTAGVVATFDVEPTDVTDRVPVRDPNLPDDFPFEDVVANWDWLVPWNGGFFLGAAEQVRPDGVSLEGDEAFELLGQEMVDALNENLVTSSADAEGVLRSAGFETEVDALLADNPDVFAAFYSYEWPHRLSGHFSPDGETWSPLVVDLPEGMASPQSIRSDGERLVVLAGQRSSFGPDIDPIAVWSTTDLTSWTAQIIPIEPADASLTAQASDLVNVFQIPSALSVSATGWVATTETFGHLDQYGIVSDRLGRIPTGLSSSSVDGVLTIEATFDDGPGETIVVDLDDLGLTAAERQMVDGQRDRDVWAGEWNSGDTTELPDFEASIDAGPIAYDGGVATWSQSAVTVVTAGGEATSFRAPSDGVAIIRVLPNGEELVVFAGGAEEASIVFSLDPSLGEWTQFEISGVPDDLAIVSTPSDDVWLTAVYGEPLSTDAVSMFEQGDFRYTHTLEMPRSSYEVRRISTEEIVVSESIDLTEAAIGVGDGPFEFLLDGLDSTTILHPETGEVLIEMTREQMDAMFAASTRPDGTPVPDWSQVDLDPRDNWLLVPDGDRWLARDLAEPEPDEDGVRSVFIPLAARSGEVVLVQDQDGWSIYDLN